MTILVVDDDRDVLTSLRLLLEQESYNVVTTGDPLRVSELLQRNPVDLIITDNRMPAISGIDLVDIIQKTVPGIPVILITGDADLETALEAIHKGIFDFLIKPVNPDYLLLIVKRAIRHHELLRLERNYLKDLETQVSRKTYALEQSLLETQLAMEEANKAYRVKSEFLANITHEVRTPINGIHGMLQLMSETPLSFPQAEYLRMALTSTETMMKLLNDILDFSKLEERIPIIENECFDLRQSLREHLESWSLQADQRRLGFFCRIGKDVPRAVSGDSGRLNQVLSILLDNALKFTGSGKVEVVVETGRLEKNIALIAFHVFDTGPGISSDRFSVIFEPFTQLDSSLSRSQLGAGLGLSIAKTLVELMGGALGVNSTVGAGSEFSFSLPFRVTDQDGQSQESACEWIFELPGDESAREGSFASRLMIILENTEKAISDGDVQLTEYYFRRIKSLTSEHSALLFRRNALRFILAFRNGDSVKALKMLKAMKETMAA